jgi:hypothetical protein
MMKVLIFVLASSLGLSGLQAQEGMLPKVFVLGEHEAAYDQLQQTYRQTLLEACNNNMSKAFDQWLAMMKEVETYAEKMKYNLNGVKVIMHVFWNEDGTIAHLGYFLRPNSRNVKAEELTAFFTGFIAQYKFPVTSGRKFTHYTKATFPTFSERAER